MAVTRHLPLIYCAAPSAAHPQLALPPARRSRPVSSPHPTPPNPALLYASAERAKPSVLHVGVERIGKEAALSKARVYR
eukprot:scaffold10182_cov64-Phaeocystis_antarctica.AAC.2